MTNAMLSFTVCWAGSNMKIASLLVPATNPADQNNIQLQKQVGALVKIDSRHIKILLGSPAGPQLTPVLYTSALVCSDTKIEDLPSHKAMVAAWSSLTPGQVYNVFVTQNSPVDLAIDEMARGFKSNEYYKANAYANFPLTLQRNPAVALAALDVGELQTVRLPDELYNNKKFLLAALSRTCAKRGILCFFSDTLCDDEEVALKAVARHERDIWSVSDRLYNDKSFLLKSISVNSRCIVYGPTAFRSDKEFALAAVQRNPAVLKYLCERLKADKDIQRVCGLAQTDS